MQKYNIDIIKEIIKSKDGICLSNKYTNTKTPLKILCNKDNNKWITTADSIIHGGTWCSVCAKNKKYTISDVKKIAKSKGGECLSNKYINGESYLSFKCNLGHIWKNRANNVIGGQWCKICANKKRRLPLEDMQKIAKEKGGECLSTEYINCISKLKWKCKEGHVWEARPHDIKNNNGWCPVCSGHDKYTINDMIKIARMRNGKCLSKKYINTKTRLEWQCNKCNSLWLSQPRSIIQGSWCPSCSSYKSERLSRIYIETVTGKKFPKTKPEWLQGLELDGYCKELKLAFEYNGKQHYEYINFYHKNDKGLKHRMKLDILKKNICKQKNIKLIVVPYIYSCKNEKEMYRFIDKELNKNNIKIKQ